MYSYLNTNFIHTYMKFSDRGRDRPAGSRNNHSETELPQNPVFSRKDAASSSEDLKEVQSGHLKKNWQIQCLPVLEFKN